MIKLISIIKEIRVLSTKVPPIILKKRSEASCGFADDNEGYKGCYEVWVENQLIMVIGLFEDRLFNDFWVDHGKNKIKDILVPYLDKMGARYDYDIEDEDDEGVSGEINIPYPQKFLKITFETSENSHGGDEGD